MEIGPNVTTMNAAETMFAPGERADQDTLDRDAESLQSSDIAGYGIDRVPVFVTLLNRQRQIVYANKPLLDFLGVASVHAVLGKRPGEALDCIHAHKCACGCGTTEFCRECGAVKSILKSQQDRVVDVAECHLTSVAGVAMDLRVWASPFSSSGRDYTLFIAMDVGHEKRRHALEQTFIHDINNLLSVLIGSCECLDPSDLPQRMTDFTRRIIMILGEVDAEIKSYGKLMQAEDGHLLPNLANKVGSLTLMNELMELSTVMWPGRSVVRADPCDDFTLMTDRVLLFRVLYNMLKNAIEASRAPQRVLIGCSRIQSSALFTVHNPGFMPRPIQMQVFQRSFSTKATGRGLGTYSMKLYGEQCLGGKVWFDTTEAAGTTFSISLPLSNG